MARERETVAQMIAACMREVAELVLVFGSLDIVIADKAASVGKLTAAASVLGVFVILFTTGVVVERIRKEKTMINLPMIATAGVLLAIAGFIAVAVERRGDKTAAKPDSEASKGEGRRDTPVTPAPGIPSARR